MEFYNLNRELDKLAACSNLELEVALDAMIALITDLRNIHHVKFADGSFDKPSTLNTKLSRLANELIRVYDAKKGSFQQIPRDYFPPDIRRIEREILEIQNRLLDQEEQLEKAESVKTRLAEKLEQEQQNLNALQEQQARIQSLTDTLNSAIAQAKAIDLPGLEERKAALEQENTGLAQKKNQLVSDISSLEESLANVRSDCGCRENDCARLSGELEQCRAKLAAAEELRKNLESQLSDAEEKEAAAGTRSGELSRLISESASRLEQLSGQITDKNAELQTAKSEIASRERACSDLSEKLAGAEAALSDIESRISTAQQDIDAVTASVTAADAALADKQQTHRTMLENLDTLNQDISAEDAAIARLDADIRTANADLNSMTGRHSTLQAQLSSLQTQIHSLDSENGGLYTTLSELRRQVQELTDAKANADDQIIALGQTADQLSADLNAANTRIGTLNSRNTELTDALTNSGVRIGALTQEIDRLTVSLDAAAAEEADLSAQAAAATAKEQALNDKIDQHKQVLERLANVDIEIICAGDSLTKAQDDLHAASDKLRRTNEEIAAVEEQTGTLERDIAQQEQQLRGAEDTRLARQNERDRLITKLAEAQTETQTLQTHSDELTAQLERTNAAAEELRRSITQVNADIEAAKTTNEALTTEFYTLENELDYQNSLNEDYRADPLKTTADELAAAKLTYEGLVAQHGDLKNQLNAVAEDRRRVDRAISTTSTFLRKCQDELAESTRVLEDREAELQSRQIELDTLRERIARNADDVKDIIQEIDEATEILNNWDPVGTKAKYESKRKELDERLSGVKAMRKKLEEDTAQLEELRAETSEQRRQQDAIRTEYRVLSDEFSRLRDPKTKEELDRFSASISVMKEVRRRIKAAAGYLPDAPDLPGEVPAALQANLDFAGETLEALRSGVGKYLEIYGKHTELTAEQS